MRKIILFLFILSLTGCKSNTNQTNIKAENDLPDVAISQEEKLPEKDKAVVVLKDVTGFYQGNIDVNGTLLPLTLTIDYAEVLTGYIDIKIQNVFDIKLEDVKIDQNQVSFMIDLKTSKGYFEGAFVDQNYSGFFTQNNQTFPFEFVLGEVVLKENRQALDYSKEGITLKGEYILPMSQDKMPVALIIGGSGATDMDGNSRDGVYTNAYLYLAEALEQGKIATLRYNKRILDNEISSELEISFEDLVEDAFNLTERLKADDRFGEVYLIGHSQGALIAEIVAERTKVDKIVLLAGAGRTIDHVFMDQLSGQLNEEQLSQAKVIVERLKAGETIADVPEMFLSLFRESIQPFLISWLKYDPQVIIEKIDTDILIVAGGYDLQVSLKNGENLHASRPDADFVVIDTMNHVLKETTDDINENFKTYTNVNLPVHSELIKVLTEFLNK